MDTGKRGTGQGVDGSDGAPPPPVIAFDFVAVVASEYLARCSDDTCVTDDTLRRRAIADDAGHGRTHDPGLLATYQLASVSEPCTMVDTDCGNQRNAGFEDVHRVQATAETYLHDGDVDPRPIDDVRCGEGSELEERERDVPARHIDSLERLDDFGIGHCPAIDPHPLVVAGEVRRRVRPHPQAGGRQNRFEKPDTRPLAVGAGDHDAWWRGHVEPERFADAPATFQPEVDCSWMQRGLPFQPFAERSAPHRSHRVLWTWVLHR